MYSLEELASISASINLGSISQIEDQVDELCQESEALEGTMAYCIVRSRYCELILFLRETYGVTYPRREPITYHKADSCLLFG